ncbi:MAG: potassium channel protein [Saprospirales bacterium]|nr:potassium channel protein [Saprospirales bacterium]MBK8492408.1 potassium channel protein [Saprospirales bacterium]
MRKRRPRIPRQPELNSTALGRIKGAEFFQYTGSYLSMRISLLLLLGSLTMGVGGFIYLEGYSLREAFYMTIITISTVGYTEVRPLSPDGQIFVSFLILLYIGVFTYSVSAFSYYVIQGEFFKQIHLNFLAKKIKELRNHVIICGFGKYGKEIAAHFLAHRVPFVVIERATEEIEAIQKGTARILYIEDDATHDEALVKAGIEHAAALISALPDDAENVFTVLSARQLNPRINIISRARDPKSQRKLMRAGANHVVMPEQIGGFYMATLVSKPGAVEFFSFITNHYGSDIDFEELHYEQLPPACQGSSIRELSLRKASGINIIGFKKGEGEFIVNPEPDVVLVPGSSFILMGNTAQMHALHDYLDHYEKA